MKDQRNRWESCLHMLVPETMQVKTTCPRAYKKDGTLYTDKESCKTCKAWKGWECKTRREILMIVAKDCSKCFYGSCVMNGDKSTCEYLAVTGHKGLANRGTAGKQECLNRRRREEENK